MKQFSKIVFSNPQKALFDLAQHSNDLVIVADRGRRILYVNPAGCRKTGYTREELVGQKVPVLHRREHRAAYTAKIYRELKRKGGWAGELELRKKDGSTFWVAASMLTYHDDHERIGGTMSIARDLTDERLLVQRSMEAESPLQQIIESMGDAVCVCARDGKILMVNSAHSEMLGCGKEEIIGMRPPYPWIDPMDEGLVRTLFKRVAREGTVRNVPLRWLRRDHKRIVVSVAMSRYSNPSQGIEGQVCTIRDVTNVQYAEELRKANERIQRLVYDTKQKSLRLKTLEGTNALVLHQAGIKRIFAEIVKGVKNLVGHDLAGMYVYDVRRESFLPHTLSKQTKFSRLLAKFPLRLGQGIIGEAALSGKMVWINNAHLDPRSRYPEGVKPSCEHFIAVPLKSGDTLFGVLVVARNRDPQFMEEEAVVIKSFADAACVALENARMIHELTQAQRSISEKVFADVSRPRNGSR